LDPSLIPLKGQDFWHHYFATQNRHCESELPQMPPTDRSSTQLPCGVGITTAIKKRVMQDAGEFLPTLVVTVVQEQGKVGQIDKHVDRAAGNASSWESDFITQPIAPPTYSSQAKECIDKR
jgi:hypothetical protein